MVRFYLWHVTLLLWAVFCAGVPAALGGDLDCDVASVVPMGDGRCDEEYNTEGCGYDGGDCCACTCWDNEFPCGVTGYSCVDPDAPCHIPGSVFRDLAESNGSGSPTSSPTSSVTAAPPVVDDNDGSGSPTSSPTSSVTAAPPVVDDNDGSGSPTSSPTPGLTAAPPVIDDNDADTGVATDSTSNSSSSSSTTGVIVGVSAAVVVIGVGMYFYRKKRSSARYDATSEYASAGNFT